MSTKQVPESITPLTEYADTLGLLLGRYMRSQYYSESVYHSGSTLLKTLNDFNEAVIKGNRFDHNRLAQLEAQCQRLLFQLDPDSPLLLSDHSEKGDDAA